MLPQDASQCTSHNTHAHIITHSHITTLSHMLPQDASQDDLDREEMYARAEELDQHLGGMESSLKKIVHDYNHARQPSAASSSSSGSHAGRIVGALGGIRRRPIHIICYWIYD